jgi:hypothetical protein
MTSVTLEKNILKSFRLDAKKTYTKNMTLEEKIKKLLLGG